MLRSFFIMSSTKNHKVMFNSSAPQSLLSSRNCQGPGTRTLSSVRAPFALILLFPLSVYRMSLSTASFSSFLHQQMSLSPAAIRKATTRTWCFVFSSFLLAPTFVFSPCSSSLFFFPFSFSLPSFLWFVSLFFLILFFILILSCYILSRNILVFSHQVFFIFFYLRHV